MRTTLTLDPDVAQLVEDEVHRRHQTLKHVVNEALRRGLSRAPSARREPAFRVKPHRTTLCAGIDPLSFNELVDELEDDAIAGKIARGR